MERMRAISEAAHPPAPEAPQDRPLGPHPPQVQWVAARDHEALGAPAVEAGVDLVERVPAEDRWDRRYLGPALPAVELRRPLDMVARRDEGSPHPVLAQLAEA